MHGPTAFPWRLPAGVRAIEPADPAEELRDMRRGDWALVMTHSHDEDFALCRALLERGDFGWAGVIGSLPKATRFRQRLLRRGFSPRQVARLVMPIGIGRGSLHGRRGPSLGRSRPALRTPRRDSGYTL